MHQQNLFGEISESELPKSEKKPRNISISWLNSFGYCEYSIFLKYIEHIEVKPTLVMLKGTKKHAKLDTEFKETAEEAKEPFETLIPKVARGEAPPFWTRDLRVRSNKYGLIGKIDEANFSRDIATILDDKPGTQTFVYPNVKHQVWAYCLAFREHYAWDKEIACQIRSTETKSILYNESFSSKNEEIVSNVIQNMRDSFDGKREFESSKSKGKCAACSLKNHCPRSLC